MGLCNHSSQSQLSIDSPEKRLLEIQTCTQTDHNNNTIFKLSCLGNVHCNCSRASAAFGEKHQIQQALQANLREKVRFSHTGEVFLLCDFSFDPQLSEYISHFTARDNWACRTKRKITFKIVIYQIGPWFPRGGVKGVNQRGSIEHGGFMDTIRADVPGLDSSSVAPICMANPFCAVGIYLSLPTLSIFKAHNCVWKYHVWICLKLHQKLHSWRCWKCQHRHCLRR